MALQVNVFGQQVGAADLLTADERLANIQNEIYRQQSMSNFQTIIPNYISNQSRFAREGGVPEFVDNSWAASGGAALDREEVLGPGSQRNIAPVDVRQEQLIRSANQAASPKQTLSAATGFSPAVQMLIDNEIQRTGIDPTESLDEEQLQAARQIGIIPRKHGVTPYSKSGGGNQNQLPPLWGDIARFFEPSMDPEQIVGDPASSEPALIPAGVGGVLEKALSNAEVAATGQANLGQNTPADTDVLLRGTEFLRDVREQMSEALFNASIDKTDPENPRLTAVGRAIEQEYGVGHYNNPSLAGIGAVGYYTALSDSRYADFSKEEKADHKMHRMRHGENHPDLYSSDSFGGNRPMRTRQLAHLEDEIGSAMEVAQQMKFKNPKNKQIISQVIKNAMADMGRSYSLVVPKTEYMNATSGPVPLVFNPAEIRAGAAEGFFPIEGITFQKRMGKSRLGKIMGILMELQPAKRKNSSFVPLPEIALNEKNPNQPRTIKGVSAVRNWMVNFAQSIPNKLDPYQMNILTALQYQSNTLNAQDEHGLPWKHIVNNIMKIKETGINIMHQQYTDVKNNGGIFYNSVTQWDNGRHASAGLAGMQGLPGQRISTIPVTPTTINLTSDIDPATYSYEEKQWIAATMTSLDFKDWEDGLGSSDTLKYRFIEKRFKELLNPSHPIRVFQSKLKAYEQALRLDPIAPASDYGLFWGDGIKYLTDKNSLHALWSLTEFIHAKNNPRTSIFLDPYVTGLDSNESGLFGESLMLGDIEQAKGGGLITQTYNSPFYRDETGILEAEKTYMRLISLAKGIFLERVKDNEELSDFTELYFQNGTIEADLKNLFQKEFGKKTTVGGQYGQGKDASADVVTQHFIEWLERLDSEVNPVKSRDKIMEAINTWAEVPHEPYWLAQQKDGGIRTEPTPVIYFDLDATLLPKIRKNNNKIIVEGKPAEMLQSLAKMYGVAMRRASPTITDYVTKMRNIYAVSVELAGYSLDTGLDLPGEVELPIYEPNRKLIEAGEDIYDENGRIKNSEVGNRINLLEQTIDDDWVSIPYMDQQINEETGGIDTHSWNQRMLWYNRPINTKEGDLTRERERLDFDSVLRERSTGMTRTPVVSLHILDDAALAMTCYELKRKYGDEFDWFNHAWDEGIIRKHFRERFADEYNKAWVAILLENNYFQRSAEGWANALKMESEGGVMTPERLAIIYETKEYTDSKGEKSIRYVNPQAVDSWETLQRRVIELKNDAIDLEFQAGKRGNITKLVQNINEFGVANMNPNTPGKYEEGMTTKRGLNVASNRKSRYKPVRNNLGQFQESIVKKGLKKHPGLRIDATLEERMELSNKLNKK